MFDKIINKVTNKIIRTKHNQFFEKKINYARLEDIVFLSKCEVNGDYDADKKIFSVKVLVINYINHRFFLSYPTFSDRFSHILFI